MTMFIAGFVVGAIVAPVLTMMWLFRKGVYNP